ncbi:chorismate mutase [Planctomicrobium sp. SH527]|uniref:chorismate mutase n=1 Tax=Planctomicrobium sp. SH527 TaxID=3448123 RepID=UPI003F5B3D95
MPVRGIRGAISCSENSQQAILEATRDLLREIISKNELTDFEEVVSAIFTTTPDLNASFPAEAARDLGMNQVPLLCASEIAVPTGLPKIIRILLHVNSEKRQAEMVHVYLGAAKNLRKDISEAQ